CVCTPSIAHYSLLVSCASHCAGAHTDTLAYASARPPSISIWSRSMHHTPRLRRPPSSSIPIPSLIWCSFTAAYGVCETTGQSSSLSSCGSAFVFVSCIEYRISHIYHISTPLYSISRPGRRQVSFRLGSDSLRLGICLLCHLSGRARWSSFVYFSCPLLCLDCDRSPSIHRTDSR
ncbi:hypothetical protein B0H13DRAFT_2412268, partial [Mycena leptocephala]